MLIVQRDYQNQAEADVRAAMRLAHAVLLVLPTGSGKTVLFSGIAQKASAKGKRVLILAHRDTLIKQASRKLDDYGVRHGIIMAAFTPDQRRGVQVASVQTLVRRIEKMKAAEAAAAARAKDAAARAGKTPEEVNAAATVAARGLGFDLIIIDEAHLSAAASYMKVVQAWPDARVLGVTGSPIRLDGRGLGRHAGGMFDTIVEGVKIRYLIQQGYLAKPVVYAAPETIDLAAVRKVGGDYDAQALAAVMDKPKITGSAIEQWRKICPDVPAVAWCANVAHAQHVAAEFNAAGIPAQALSGEDDPPARDRALAALASGKIKIITFAMLLVEGVDCPAIGAVILLRPTMSLSSYLQVIGRGLRTIYAEGMPIDTVEQRHAAILAGPKGPKCFVLDHAGLWAKHGFADQDREWSLDGAPKKNGKKKDEDALPVCQCPKCWMVHEPAPVCPGCGHVYEVKVRHLEHAEGELVLVSEDMAVLASRQRKDEVRGAKTLADLERIGAQRGYSPGWAKAAFEARARAAAKYRRRP